MTDRFLWHTDKGIQDVLMIHFTEQYIANYKNCDKTCFKKISKAIPKSTVGCCEKIPLACRAQLCAR